MAAVWFMWSCWRVQVIYWLIILPVVLPTSFISRGLDCLLACSTPVKTMLWTWGYRTSELWVACLGPQNKDADEIFVVRRKCAEGRCWSGVDPTAGPWRNDPMVQKIAALAICQGLSDSRGLFRTSLARPDLTSPEATYKSEDHRTSHHHGIPENTVSHPANHDLMLGHRRRRWCSIEPEFRQRLLFAGCIEPILRTGQNSFHLSTHKSRSH